MRVEDPLGGPHVERGEGDRAEVEAVAEAEQADDAQLLRRAAQQHPHPVADVEAVLLRGGFVHRHLARPTRRPAAAVGHQAERPAVDPRDAERGRTAGLDALPAAIDELRVPVHEALGTADTPHGPHIVEDGVAHALGIARVAEGPRVLHGDVDPRQRLAEHGVERLLHRVGQHVGGAHEAHPEEHRDRGEGEAHLAGEDAPDRRLPHAGAAPLSALKSWSTAWSPP